MINNIVGITLFYGLALTCDVTVPQAIAAGNPSKVGLILQKGIFIEVLASVLCATMFINLESLLLFLGQNPHVAKYAGIHAEWYSLGLPAHALWILLFRYQICQGYVLSVGVISLLSAVVGFFLHWLLIIYFSLGVGGAGASLALTRALGFVMMVMHILVSGTYKNTWNGWTVECLYDWWGYLAIAIPATFMMSLEWWCYEIVLFVTGFLGKVSLGSYVIVYNYTIGNFTIATAIGVSCNIILGSYIGAGDIDMAKTTCRIVTFFGVVGCSISVIITVSLHKILPSIFSNDSEVTTLASSLMLVSLPQQFFINFKEIHAGLIRAKGDVTFGAWTSFVSFYVVGLCIALPLMLHTNLGVFGCPIGLGIGCIVLSCLYVLKMHLYDWTYETNKIIEMKHILESIKISSYSEKINCINENDLKQNSTTNNNVILTKMKYLTEECQTPVEQMYMKDEISDKNSSTSVCKIIALRLTIVAFCFAILGAGIAFRLCKNK